jgi:hypothetical protein
MGLLDAAGNFAKNGAEDAAVGQGMNMVEGMIDNATGHKFDGVVQGVGGAAAGMIDNKINSGFGSQNQGQGQSNQGQGQSNQGQGQSQGQGQGQSGQNQGQGQGQSGQQGGW